MGYQAALLLAIIGTAAAQVMDESSALTAPLMIFLRNARSVSPGVLEPMQREVESLVAPSGIRVKWKLEKNSEDQEAYDQIAVVDLLGECSTSLASRSAIPVFQAEALGQTQTVDGQVLPFTVVRCNAVRQLIDSELRATAGGRREELLGRALGRVMAHELYHVLLRTTSHGRSGLGRAAQSRVDLVAPHDPFSEADERKLSELGRAETWAMRGR